MIRIVARPLLHRRRVVGQFELRRRPRQGARPKAPLTSSERMHFMQTGRSFGMGGVVSIWRRHLLTPLTADNTCFAVGGCSDGITP